MHYRSFGLTILALCGLLFAAAAFAQPSNTLYLPLVPDAQPSATATQEILPSATATTEIPPSPTATIELVPSPTNTTQPLPTPTPTLPPADFVDCKTVGDPSRAPDYPVVILEIDKEDETVTLHNNSLSAVDLTGWRMCSLTGNQEHPISGTLSPGQTRVFVNNGGLIWNNLTSDPGALWNPSGQLISYFAD